MKTMPTRIDGDLFEAAKVAGEAQSRSAAQQLDHWVRIGRELDASPAVTRRQIDDVLAGRTQYDDLTDRAQAVVRATWDEQLLARIEGLSYVERLEAAGQPWAESDTEGNVVMRNAGSTPA